MSWQDKQLKHNNRIINVKNLGAKGDGITDDTTAINAAIERAGKCRGTVLVPCGIYLVVTHGASKGAIIMRSNVTLKLAKNAVIQLAANPYNECYVIDGSLTSNIRIEGGAIIGDKDTHDGTTGEWGMGIHLEDARNVVIKDINISKCWGDGVYIGSKSASGYSQSIVLDKVICDNNRRNGISLISVNGLYVRDCQANNTNGVAPQSGLQIEPDYHTQFLQNIMFDNFVTNNNAGAGIWVWLGNYAGSTKPIGITITNHKDYGSVSGTYKDILGYINEGYGIRVRTTLNFRNILTGGNFPSTAGWTGALATISAADNTLSIQADGTAAFGLAHQVTGYAFAAGTRLFYQFKARVTNAACTVFKGDLREGSWYGIRFPGHPDEGTPVQNQWYTDYDLSTIPAGGTANLTAVLRHEYADAATALNKVMQVKEAQVIDLTPFGAYVPTVYECAVLFRNWR